MKLLITAIGRRVQLIKELAKECTIIGVDCDELSPAKYFVDKFYKVSKCSKVEYLDELLKICSDEKIGLLVPLFEPEFEILEKNKNKFSSIGTIVLLSNKTVLDICNNKINTYKFFTENNIDTPVTFTVEEINKLLYTNKKLNYPFIVKPKNGMGSSNVFKVKDESELRFFIKYVKDPIIQEYINGTEYTIDCFCDLNGKIISVVPRERLEVRSGEVSKSRIVDDKNIILKTKYLLEKLKTPIGPFTIQCKVNNNKIKYIEINPRFGGGVPLSIKLGVNYGLYFNKIVQNKEITPFNDKIREVTMIRYDEAIYFE